MAQPPAKTATPPPNADAARSHGRGGAGNINAKPSTSVTSNDLQTPTIKSATYTTGRGGSGNMAKNNPNDPSESRAAQDVDTPVHHNKDMQGTYHWGRGGEGNMTTIGKSEREQSKERPVVNKNGTLSNEGKERSGSFKGAIEKGREMLGFKGKAAGADPKNESAIE